MPAAFHITFFGTQPTLTQVPPSRPDSITALLAPYSAARCAQARPPLPPPMLMRSKTLLDTVNSVVNSVAARGPDVQSYTRRGAALRGARRPRSAASPPRRCAAALLEFSPV